MAGVSVRRTMAMALVEVEVVSMEMAVILQIYKFTNLQISGGDNLIRNCARS